MDFPHLVGAVGGEAAGTRRRLPRVLPPVPRFECQQGRVAAPEDRAPEGVLGIQGVALHQSLATQLELFGLLGPSALRAREDGPLLRPYRRLVMFEVRVRLSPGDQRPKQGHEDEGDSDGVAEGIVFPHRVRQVLGVRIHAQATTLSPATVATKANSRPAANRV